MKKRVSKGLVLFAALFGVLSLAGCNDKVKASGETSTATSSAAVTSTLQTPAQNDERKIPVPANYEIGGAASYANIGDQKNSVYFAHPDYYEMKSEGSLLMLEKMRTYQQTTEVTCGPVSALMALYHYGVTDWEELQIAEIMQTHKDINGTNTEEPGVADEPGEFGTSTQGMVKFFEQIGWNVESSLTKANEDGYSFTDPEEFVKWIKTHLKEDKATMIEWVDWAGHWQLIAGYDDMGNDNFGDDVIILADPYDTSDHLQDGFYAIPAERFFYMWFDKGILPEGYRTQQWLTVSPKS